MVHFNRFNQDGKIGDEIGGSATLPINGRVYHLTGVLVHDGPSVNRGHYFCDVISPPYSQTGVAYRCNDSDYPEQISSEMLGTSFKTAYMQIYVLSDELPTSPPATLIANNAQGPLTAATESAPSKQPDEPTVRRTETVSCQGTGLPTTNLSDINASTNDLDELALLIAQRESILSIPPAKRTSADNNRKRKVNEKIRKMTPKRPALTNAERKQLQRQDETKRAKERARRQDETQREKERAANTESKRAQRQDETRREKERAANTENKRVQRQDETQREKERTANTESKRAQRQDETKREKERNANTMSRRAQRQDETRRGQERADDRMRRTAKRASVVINPRAGLNSGLTLSGHFKVEKHSLGLMDKVKISESGDQLIIHTFTRCVRSAEHGTSGKRLVAGCAAWLAR